MCRCVFFLVFLFFGSLSNQSVGGESEFTLLFAYFFFFLQDRELFATVFKPSRKTDFLAVQGTVSYTHLTLPTKRIV